MGEIFLKVKNTASSKSALTPERIQSGISWGSDLMNWFFFREVKLIFFFVFRRREKKNRKRPYSFFINVPSMKDSFWFWKVLLIKESLIHHSLFICFHSKLCFDIHLHLFGILVLILVSQRPRSVCALVSPEGGPRTHLPYCSLTCFRW